MKTILDQITVKVLPFDTAKLSGDILCIFANKEGKLFKQSAVVSDKWSSLVIDEQLDALSPDYKQDKFIIFGAPGKTPSRVQVSFVDGKSQEDAASEYEDGVLVSKTHQSKTVETLSIVLESAWSPDYLQKFIEGVLLGTYFYKKPGKSQTDKKLKSIKSICFYAEASTVKTIQDVVNETLPVVKAVFLVRDLVNHPANMVNPSSISKLSSEVAKSQSLKLKVFEDTDLKKQGMNLILAVGMGSAETPRMVHLEYQPKQKAKMKIALVGKGVTFDSGGLSLKPQANMYGMKGDMAGAATMLAIASVVKELNLPLHIHFIFPLVENLVSDCSVKPGDVFLGLNGKSVEIENTDAEGRLILADALTYAESLKVDQIIDAATLTGAVLVALGDDIAGVLGTDQSMIDEIKSCGERVAERFWQLPLEKKYLKQLKSDVADLKNVGGGRSGGCIIGALFLSEFVDKTPWVHLDIAGPSFSERDQLLLPKGGTGFSVRTLIDYLKKIS